LISVNTETTENEAGWILYDGDCALCTRWVARLYRPLRRRGFRFAPLQAPWVGERFGLGSEDPLFEMRLVTPGGRTLGGADAVAEICRSLWWVWPVWLLFQLPGGAPIFRSAYRWLARHRHCLGGSCEINGRHSHSPDHSVSSSFYELP
jgi:predicted DCC family thiol-disulfide oxidoreductase YuxK